MAAVAQCLHDTEQLMLCSPIKLLNRSIGARSGACLCKEGPKCASSRGYEWGKEWYGICSRLVVEGHENVASPAGACISSADQKVLQRPHAVPHTIHWKVTNLHCYCRVMYALVPFVVDFVRNAQVVEVGRKWGCNDLRIESGCCQSSDVGRLKMFRYCMLLRTADASYCN